MKTRGVPDPKPYYHRATIIFTSTRPFLKTELEEILDRKIIHPHVVKYSLEVENVECVAVGFPEDL